MQKFTEMEVQIIQKQRRIMKKVLADPSYAKLETALREAIELSLAQTQEVLI